MGRKSIRVGLVLGGFLCLLIVISELPLLRIDVSYGSFSINQLQGRVIDLYTQRDPFSGKGLHQPSDVFAPQEEISLYANVTYNAYPVAGKNVAFEIESPLGLWDLGTATTGENGIATWSSRLPNETSVNLFGAWHAYATVDIAEETVRDTLAFKFGYIVEIISLRTINKNLQPQSRFARTGCVGIELALRNNAMTSRMATLSVVVHDSQGTPLPEKIVFEDFLLNPGDTYFYLYCVLEIPEWAALGEALLIASAFTAPPAEGGVPWCPSVSTSFLIVWCDVAVINVVPSVGEVMVGGVLEVNVHVVNEGYEAESFNVSLYYDSVLIGERSVASLASGMGEMLVFVWNTSGVAVGDYRLKAIASVVPGEVDVADNVFEDGVVRVVKEWKPPAPVPPALPRELILLLLLSMGALAIILILYIWYRKSGETPEEDNDFSARPFGSNPDDFGSSVRLRGSLSSNPRESDSHSERSESNDLSRKFKEVSFLMQPGEGVPSDVRSEGLSPEEVGKAISSLKHMKGTSDSSVFAVIRLPFVERLDDESTLE